MEVFSVVDSDVFISCVQESGKTGATNWVHRTVKLQNQHKINSLKTNLDEK